MSKLYRSATRRAGLLAGAAVLALAGQAAAQDATDVEEVVVTASRVNIAGFTAPTPTTVISAADVQRVAPTQVSEVLAQLPQFRAASQTSTASTYANLRSIGAQRTLLLVDGRRHVPTFSDGTVDLGLIPTSLIARTEIVTGGASASWGSDAVAGVVNLLLKKDLQGVEGSIQGGMSQRRDAETFAASLAWGSNFAGDKGHILVGAEYAFDDGIRSLQPPYFSRHWYGRGTVGNTAFATNGLPGTIYSDDVRRADTSVGGLVTSGPLRGLEFVTGGTTSQFGFGQVFTNNMIGGVSNPGEGPVPGGDLRFPLERYAIMAHVDYDLTDGLSIFGEASFGHSISEGHGAPNRNNGATTVQACTQTVMVSALGSINVNINNAFLPASTRAAMQAAGITCFAMGRTFRDDGMGELRTADGTPHVWRGVAGFNAELGGTWSMDGYVQYGEARYQARRKGNMNVAKFRNAIDAIVGPAGTPVCRINADALTTNDDPACVAFNLFGNNAPSEAAKAYILGDAELDSDTRQTVVALNIDGELFHTWAGPIGAAAGAEYRKEEVDTRVDPISQATGWQTGNRRAIAGGYNVKEVFGELAIPLAKDAPLFQAFDVNLAIRYTDYSSSGGVTTWKAGVSWALTDELRLRATQSRDIRAGNLGELYTATNTATVNIQDPRTAAIAPTLQTTTGNPDLDPEKADTFTAGVIYQPHWLSGLRLSADYYNIEIKGVIGTILGQQVVNRCFIDNLPQFCAQVSQTAGGVINGVTNGFENLDRFKTSGWDFEAVYSMPAERIVESWSGDLRARVLANYVKELATTAAANATVTDPSGQYTQPHWTVFTTLSWQGERVGLALEGRWFEGGTIDNTKVEGLIAANGANINHTGATFYANMTATLDLGEQLGSKGIQLFARVNNMFDEAPPFPNPGQGVFDEIGRAYRLGVRFKY